MLNCVAGRPQKPQYSTVKTSVTFHHWHVETRNKVSEIGSECRKVRDKIRNFPPGHAPGPSFWAPMAPANAIGIRLEPPPSPLYVFRCWLRACTIPCHFKPWLLLTRCYEFSLSQTQLHRCQRLQNAAARVVALLSAVCYRIGHVIPVYKIYTGYY